MPELLPSGEVTFAFVDVVGSTRAFSEHGDGFVAALSVVQRHVAACTARRGGVVVKTEGDGAFLAFSAAADGVRALVDAQVAVESWTEVELPRLRVRAGLHTGWARPVAGDYVALAVNVAARVCSAARAGQVLASAATLEALEDEELRAAGEMLGEFSLKDVAGPSVLWRMHGEGAPPAAPPFRRTNVAEPRSSFVGRSVELSALRELLEAHRLVSVVAPGGMGKTRLVSQLLLADQHRYAGGAWLVELAGVAEPDQVVRQAAQSIPDAGDARTADELAGALAARFGGEGELLVVLDNCEHVLDAAAEVAVAVTAAGVRVLTTTREALRVADEVVWRLPPLTGEEQLRELFLARMSSAGGVLEADDPAIGALCRRLDGMPLAIELAAGQAVEVPPAALLKLLEAGEETLARRGAGRQSSLDALVAWSLDRLDTDRRDALLALSLPSGRLEAEWAQDLVGRVLGPAGGEPALVLRDLVRASLVDLDAGQYRLLDTIRAVARRRIRADAVLLTRAQAAFYALADELAAPYWTGRDRNPVSEGTAELMNFWQDALIAASQSLRPGLGRAWMACSMITGGRGGSDQLLEAAETTLRRAHVGDALDIDQARTLAGALNTLMFHRRPIPVESPELDRWVALAADLPPRAQWSVVYAVATVSDDDQARRMLLADRLEEIADLTDDPYDRVVVWHVRSNAHLASGDLESALAAAQRAATLGQVDAIATDRPVLQANVAELLIDLDRPAEALSWLRRAFDARPTHYYRWFALLLLARAHQALGRIADARTALAALEEGLGPPEQATGLKRVLWADLRKAFPSAPGQTGEHRI